MQSIVGFLMCFCFFLPHGDLDQRIQEKSNQIASNPLDRQLYLERGELYILDEEYSKARSDFSFCLNHELVNARLLLGMSHSLLYLNSPDSALLFADRVLALEENHLPALELKGTILSRLEKYCDAAGTFERLIFITDHPSPALYLQTAKNWESCGEKAGCQNAIHILEDGTKRIGAISVLQRQLVSLYRQQGRYDEAIRIQSSMIENSNLKIRPYFERAQLYIVLQLSEKAKEDLRMALSLIDQLPEHKKSLSAIEDMRLEMIELLTQLK